MKNKTIRLKYFILVVALILFLPPFFITQSKLIDKEVAVTYVMVLETKFSNGEGVFSRVENNKPIIESNRIHEFVEMLSKNNSILLSNLTENISIPIDEDYMRFFLTICYENNASDTIFIDNIGNFKFNGRKVLFQNDQNVISLFYLISSMIQ